MDTQTKTNPIDAHIDRMEPWLIALRRQLHAHPEPSLEEFRTTEAIAEQLERHGVPYRVARSGRGIIAGPGRRNPERPLIAIRGDIDALHMEDDKPDVSYRSTRPGVMHGCGHDAHASMALAAALALHETQNDFPGGLSWRAIFQPAEEIGAGAWEMIREGAMEDVAAIVALHVDPDREVGRVGHRPGILTADARDLRVEVRGQGAHAARPHQAIDPVLAACQFVTTAYQALTRTIDTRQEAVLTFGSIRAGEACNVIPDRAELLGTLRTLDQDVRDRALAMLETVARGVATATGTAIQVTVIRGTDALINDPTADAALVKAARELLGPHRVETIAQPSLGGEDFSGYLSLAPGAMMRLGVASGPGWPPLHSPRFDIDERALAIGAKLLARAAVLLSIGGLGHAFDA